jgi:hypothetical protein
MANGNENEKTKSSWTPEQIIQGFKELVTALLGILILAFTIYLAFRTFSHIADTAKMNNAKDILQIMLGIAGIVVGYYFGRVPADAHAATAQSQANAANAQTEQIGAQVQMIEDKVEAIIQKVAPSQGVKGSPGAPGAPSVADDLQKIHDELRAITTASRKRR